MKTFFKILFVALVLANCGVFIILYPQHDSGSVEAVPTAETAIANSDQKGAARISLISEIEQPISSVIVQSVSDPVSANSLEIVDEVDVVETISPEEVPVSAGSIE